MHNSNYDELFASKYVEGLKEEIKATVEPHAPVTVDRAAVIAKIQQRTLERGRSKYTKPQTTTKPHQPRVKQQSTPNLQRIRQLRDYRKANNLCYFCGDKYEPGHQEVCTKRQESQVNALAANNLDKEEITEEMLNALAAEDVLAEDFCQLSLNALTSADTENCIKLKTLVHDKVMLVLLDSSAPNFSSWPTYPLCPYPQDKSPMATHNSSSTKSSVVYSGAHPVQ